jgi:Uncharacterised protein family (UPF0175)
MQLTIELPDDLVPQMLPEGSDPSRAAMEALALEAYRAHRLTEHQLAGLLGLGRYELDGFLKRRDVWLEYSAQEIEQEIETARQLQAKHAEQPQSRGE